MASMSLTNQSTLLRALRPRCLQPSVRLSSSYSSVSRTSRFASTLSRPSVTSRTRLPTTRRAFSSTPSTYFHATQANMGASEHVIAITSKAEFDEKVKNSKGAVVVDCYATWCGPCKAIAPKVEEFAKNYTDAKFYQIDVDELSEVAAEIGVRAMPTFLLYKDGEKVNEVVGANPPALEAGVKSLIA